MVVPLHQGRKSCLPSNQTTSLLGSPVDGWVGRALCAERFHVPAIQFLPSNTDAKLFGKPFVSLLPVQTCSAVAWALSTLYRSVDGHRSCSKARLEATRLVLRVGLPRAVDQTEHAWLWRLRRHKEPESRCKVEPGICNKFRVSQEN